MIRIVKGSTISEKQKEELKAIWIEAFGDTEAYINMFFEYCLEHVFVWLYEIVNETDGTREIAAAAYEFCFETSEGNKVDYGYAGAVLKKYQGRFIWNDMLESIIKRACDENIMLYTIHMDPYMRRYGKKNGLPYMIYGEQHFIKNKKSSKNLKIKKDSAYTALNIKFTKANSEFIHSSRNENTENINAEYIVYPMWFLEFIRADKEFCSNCFEKLHIEDKDYYLIGNIEEADEDLFSKVLRIEETNIEYDTLVKYRTEICGEYNVDALMYFIPCACRNEEEAAGALVYLAQGTDNCRKLWPTLNIL